MVKKKGGNSLDSGALEGFKTAPTDSQKEILSLQNKLNSFIDIFERSFSVVYTHNPKKHSSVFHTNPQNVIGFSSKETQKNPKLFYQNIHDEDKPFYNNTLNALKEGDVVEIEYRFYKAGEKLVWLRDRLSFAGKDESVETLYGLLTDITNERSNSKSQTAQTQNFAIFQEATDGILVGNKKGEIVDVNKTFLKMSGYNEQELIGEHISKLFLPEQLESKPLQFEDLFRGKRIANDRSIRKSNGELFECEMISKMLKDGRLVAFIRDISERKKSQQLLSESEEKFRKTFETDIIGMAIVDLSDKKFLEINSGLENILGVKKSKWLNRSYNELGIISTDQKSEFFEEFYSKGFLQNYEYSFTNKEGDLKTILVSATPVKIKNNESALVSVVDITERKTILETLRLQSEILENMAEGAGLIKVEDQTFVYTNPSFNKMFNYEEGELVGKHMSVLKADDDKSAAEITSEIIYGLKNNGSWKGEIKNIKKDGTVFWTFATITTFNHHKHGKVWVIAQSDITESKQINALEKKERRRLKLLHDLYRRANDMSEAEMYDFVVEQAVELTGSEFGFFYRTENEHTVTSAAWSKKLGVQENNNRTPFEIEDAVDIARCIKTKDPVFYNNEAEFPNHKKLSRLGVSINKFMCVPVTSGEKVEFIFGVGNKKEEYDYNDVLQIELVAYELNKILVRRKAEEEIKERNLRLREAEHIGKMGHYNLEWSTDELHCSDEFLRIHEIKKSGELLSLRDYYYFIHPDNLKLLKSTLVNLNLRAPSFNIIYKIITKNNNIKHLQNIGEAEFNADGKIVRIAGVVKDVTEHQNALMVIKENEEKFEKAFSTSPDAVSITKIKDGVYVDVNESFKRVLGYEREEMIGVSSLKLNIWKNDEDRVRLVAGLKEKGYIENLEAEFLTKDGEVVHGLMSAALIKFSGEEVILSITRDISKRKEVEKQLKESEERFRAILQLQPDIFFRLSKEMKFIDCFASDESILLHPIDEIIGSNAADILPSSLFKLTEEKLQETFSRNVMQLYEYRLNIDNKPQWFEARMIPSSDNEVLIIVRNITEMKKSEQALKESELKHRKMISNISDVIVVIDKRGKITYKSSNIESYFGWKPEELIGNDALNIAHPDDRELVERELQKLLSENDRKVTLEFRYLCKDGSYKPVEVTAVSLIDDPVIQGIIGNYKDISERKKTEKAIVETQRLGAIGEMSAAIAHDFNNSLQSISGNIELALLNLPDDQPIRRYLEVIRNATSDAATRVKLLQRFAGKSKTRKEYKTLMINHVIENVIIQSRPIWKDNPQKEGLNIDIAKVLESEQSILGNEGELRSVLYNILKNSVEAMPKGGKITIKTYDNENGVNILIEDTGKGMDEETRSRIFQPFFTTKGFESGRGLGMSGAYSIIKEHNGKIEVLNSSINAGTAIAINLPNTSRESQLSQQSEKRQSGRLGNVKVLWIDDEKMIRKIAQEMLEALGQDGTVVGCAEDALNIIKEEKFDLVVTDIGMPGMNGWALVDKIRELNGNSVKIAVLTGWGDQITDDKKEKHAADFVLGKPFTISQLKSLLEDSQL